MMADWLIVMRSELFPEALSFMAEMFGLEAIVFESAGEAIEWIEAVEAVTNPGNLPSVALMNVFQDDGMRGPEVAKRLRHSPLLKDIAIILTDTGRYPVEMEKQFMTESDAEYFLYLLPKFNELKAIFDSAVERRQKKNARAKSSD